MAEKKTPPRRIPTALRESLREHGLTTWGSLPKGTTLKMTSTYRENMKSDSPKILQALFLEMGQNLSEIQNSLSKNEKLSNLIEDIWEADMIEAIFSSNFIERAGMNLGETFKICQKVFQGEDIKAENIKEGTPEFERQIQALTDTSEKPTTSLLIRSRREVIQHAKALIYITTAIVANNEPLSEDLIKSTHAILVEGIDATTQKWQNYAGKYRTVVVAAGNTNFVPPKFIRSSMQRYIDEFNSDLAMAEAKEELDPIWLAAKYCQEFVLIHPFLDGNGRTCRLILNAILLKYTGIVIPLAVDRDSRAEYIGVVRRAGEEMEGPGEFAAMVLHKVHGKMKTYRDKVWGWKKNPV